MESSRYFILLAKSQNEGLSRLEKREFEKLQVNNPHLNSDADFLKKIYSDININMEADGAEVYDNIHDEIDINDIVQFEPHNPPRSRIFSIQKIAAAVAVFMTLSFLAYYFIQDSITKPEGEIVLNESNLIEKNVPKGQKLKLYLSDGSIVWLNSESKLKYPEKFGSKERVIELEGEAFFKVEKDPQKPFIVKSGELNTTALGTSFNVKNYSSESLTKVTLVTGKVRVELEDHSVDGIVLESGSAASYSKINKSIYKSPADVDHITAWKDGVLVFKDDSFETVINRLSRWYGVTFIIKDYDGKEWNYSGRFQNEYLSNILESIGFIENFDYAIENDNVTLSFK